MGGRAVPALRECRDAQLGWGAGAVEADKAASEASLPITSPGGRGCRVLAAGEGARATEVVTSARHLSQPRSGRRVSAERAVRRAQKSASTSQIVSPQGIQRDPSNEGSAAKRRGAKAPGASYPARSAPIAEHASATAIAAPAGREQPEGGGSRRGKSNGSSAALGRRYRLYASSRTSSSTGNFFRASAILAGSTSPTSTRSESSASTIVSPHGSISAESPA